MLVAIGEVSVLLVERVSAGIALLDDKRGADWVNSVWLEDLDILSGCSCILGQVYAGQGGFVEAVDQLFGIKWSRVVSDEDYQVLVDHGFAPGCDGPENDCEQLEMVWKALLQQRKQEEQV